MTPGHFLSALKNRALLELDQMVWWRHTAPMRRRDDMPLPTGKILICDLFAMVATGKAEALLSAGLRSRGLTPVVLLTSPSSLMERYYQATGLDPEFVYLDDERDAETWGQARQAADAAMSDDRDLSHVFGLAPDGFRIGRNVMSSVVRRFRTGRVDPSDPAHREAVRETLAEALATKATIERILDRVRPKAALFNERGYTPAGEVFDACLVRGVDCVQWFGAPQSDCLAYTRYRLSNRDRHPLSLCDETWEALKRHRWEKADDRLVIDYLRSNYESGAWFNRQQLQQGKKIKSADDVRTQLSLDPRKKTAVIFSHILYDATFFYGESVFSDYETWLIEAVRCAVANPALNWIVKVHPVNVWRSRMDGKPMEQLEVKAIKNAVGPLPEHVKILGADTDINTFALFSITDYGLTVRGTVGTELPCFGVPVVTAGTGRYSGRGFTIDPKTPEEFRRILSSLHDVPPLDAETMRLARLHAYGTFFLRPVPMDGFVIDFSANTYGLAALSYNVRPNSQRVSQIEIAEDVARFGRWMTEHQTGELLRQDIETTPGPSS